MAHVFPGRGFAGTPRVPTDTERLDWLERHDAMPGRIDDHSWGLALEFNGRTDARPWHVDKDGRRFFDPSGPTLRAAIDAAMAITGDIPPPAPAGPTEEH